MSNNKEKKRLGWENKPEPADAPAGETTVNVNVDADKPDTVVEKTVEKKVVVEDKEDDTPVPSTSS